MSSWTLISIIVLVLCVAIYIVAFKSKKERIDRSLSYPLVFVSGSGIWSFIFSFIFKKS